jgi:antitoxin component of MazEF toxin-antitoxin module
MEIASPSAKLNPSVGRDGAVIVRRARRKYHLGDLVARITPGNRHDETDWGEPVGKEIW